MVCIHCGSKTDVINSRHQKRRNQVWRRRRCQHCRAVFTTQEAADYSGAWLVVTSDGALEPFWRDKLYLSIHNSLQHRATAPVDATDLTDTIVQALSKIVVNSAIKRSDIVRIALLTLSRFDSVASTHYRAFHRD